MINEIIENYIVRAYFNKISKFDLLLDIVDKLNCYEQQYINYLVDLINKIYKG